ncbi:MAG: hypothetical protein ACI8P3_000059 [Saprospiraceae bacterium]|jgi:hypothetical protein
MKNTIVSLLLIATFIASCKVEQGQEPKEEQAQEKPQEKVSEKEKAQQPFDLKQYFEDIKKVNNCMGEGDSFMSLAQRLDDGIKAPLNNITSSKMLKTLYYEGDKRQIAAGPKTEVKCSDVNFVVKDRVLQRLSVIANEAAVDVLIDIYKDESLTLLGNDGKVLAKSMSKCGQIMLEKLEPIKNLRPEIGTRVVSSIKNGKVLY